MNIVQITRTFAVALVLVLTATGLWAGGAEEEPAAAADKKYVTDPTTGKVVVAPEYGGTLTYSDASEPLHADPWSRSPRAIEDVAERLGMGNWAMDRDEYGFTDPYMPLHVVTGKLAESWEMTDDTTISSTSVRAFTGTISRR